VTSKGIRVIEFNARFGDPETQVVLRRLVAPLSHLLHNAATGHLSEVAEPEFSKDVAVTVVLASEGYPVTSAPNREITGIVPDTDSVEVAHAATKLEDGKLIATGGRVLSVVSIAEDFHEARRAAYEAICGIELEGSHYRTDIALKVDEVENV
jgi:phosphoribosylamine--glycine ligase